MVDRRTTPEREPRLVAAMSMVVKLPYLEAIEFAAAVNGDVDKIVEGASAWLANYEVNNHK
jgi:hypothetical protein